MLVKPSKVFASPQSLATSPKVNTSPQPLVPSPKEFLGGYAEGVTPVPIPNTEVKPLRADGTAWVTVWESRSPPGFLLQTPRFFIKEAGRFALMMVNMK